MRGRPHSNDIEVRADVADSRQRSPLLSVSRLSIRFGGITALEDVSLDVHRGEIVGLIGPNGAGKTTLFNCLCRLYPCQSGDIIFCGASLLRIQAHRVAAQGIGRTFQNVALFKSMTTRQNLLVGGHPRARDGFLRNALRLPSVRREEAQLASRAKELIEWLELGEIADLPVMNLPFATQKRVELGRALMSGPRLLLLDEPAGGLNHQEADALVGLLRALCTRLGLTMLLVEHHMNLVMRVSDRVVALDFGRKIADGTPEQVQANPAVIQSYLGTGG